jgi:uncharacterized protein HemX
MRKPLLTPATAALVVTALIAGPGAAQCIRQQLYPLERQITSLQNQMNVLRGQGMTRQSQLGAVQASNALKLAPFASVDLNPENGVAGLNLF